MRDVETNHRGEGCECFVSITFRYSCILRIDGCSEPVLYSSLHRPETIHAQCGGTQIASPSETSAPSGEALEPRLAPRGTVKAVNPVVALAEGTIEILPGEIHASVGEKGAGKSTLVTVLAGLYHLDAGEFRPDGRPVVFRTVAESEAVSISAIYQDPTLFLGITVVENIFIERQPKGRLVLIAGPPCGRLRAGSSNSSVCGSTPIGSQKGFRSPTSKSSRPPISGLP